MAGPSPAPSAFSDGRCSFAARTAGAEPVFAAVSVGIIVLTWPSPWRLLDYGGIALMLMAPFAFFPFSKTLFLAFDLLFRPPGPDEFVRPAGGSASSR